MFYNRKYATKINNSYYMWFNEDIKSNASFNIEQCPDNTDIDTFLNQNFVIVPDNLCGIYENKKIIYFFNTIYIVDIVEAKIDNIYLKVYIPCFLNNGVSFMEMKSNRKDEMFFIPKDDINAKHIGVLNKENTLR